MAGPFRDTALCCPSEPWGQPSAIGESPLPLPKQTSSPSSPVGHGGCSQFYCLLWLAAKCKQELQLTWTGKRCGFSCSKGIWWLITTIQSGQAQPHPPRTALVRGQVVKTWAFVSWNNVVGVRRPFLTLSLSGSTMDTHLHDVADIIQESWSEVLEGAAGARQTHGVTSRDLAFSNQSALFLEKGTRPVPILETVVTKTVMDMFPDKESRSTKLSWLRRPSASVPKVNCHISGKRSVDYLHLIDVKMVPRWEWGHGRS